MQRLSGQDAYFLYRETPAALMHILKICIREASLYRTLREIYRAVFGLIACKKACPDLHQLARVMQDEVALLQQCADAAITAKSAL